MLFRQTLNANLPTPLRGNLNAACGDDQRRVRGLQFPRAAFLPPQFPFCFFSSFEVEIFPCLLEDGGYLLRAQIADAALVRVVDFLFGNELPGLDVEPDLLVGIAERHPLAGQAVHLLYGEHQVVARVVEDVLVHLELCDDVGGHLQALSQLLESGEEDLLDDLQVAEVAAGQVVHNERNLLRQSLKLVALGASQLEDIRVLLVRHDAGAGRALLR